MWILRYARFWGRIFLKLGADNWFLALAITLLLTNVINIYVYIAMFTCYNIPRKTKTGNTYWVKFEEPQQDLEGDGPYSQAEIGEEYIELAG
tara:strand:+ start:3234 stop:3509 length:276 start_codon:yes stop_codon:yes gene_type:complete